MKSVNKNIQQQEQPTAEEIGLVSVVSILRSMSDNQKSENKLLLGVNEKLGITNKNILTSVNKLQSQVSYSIMMNSNIKQQTMINLSMLDVIQNMDTNLYNIGKQLDRLSNKETREIQEYKQPIPKFEFIQQAPNVSVNNSSTIDISTIIDNINSNHTESKKILDSIDKSLKTVNRQIWFMNQPKKEPSTPVAGQPVVQPVVAPVNNQSNISTTSNIQNITNQQMNVIKDNNDKKESLDLDKISFEGNVINAIQTVNGTLVEILDIQKQFYGYYQKVNDPKNFQRVDNEIADSKLFREGLSLANRWFQKDIRATTNKNEFIFTDKNEATVHGLNNISTLISTTNTLLAQIISYSQKIYEFLPYLTSKPEEAKVNQGAQSKGIDLTYLIEGIEKLDKSITSSFLKKFAQFNKELDKLLGIESKKFLYTKISLSGLALTFKLISDKADALSQSFRRLTFSIILVSFALISPPFLLGAGVLIGILWGIRKALTGTNILFGWNLKKLSMGILMLVGAFWLMAKMPYPTLLKAIGLIAILGLAIRVFGGEHKMSFQSKTSGIFGLALGVIMLSLAFNAFSEVPIPALFKMIGFIALLGLAIRAFPVGNRTKGMFGFSMSLVLMTLSIAAFGELPFSNMLTLLGFVAGLGLIFRIFPVGNRMKGMLGFAFGMTLLVLAVDAAGEVPLSSYALVLGFVGALLGEIVLFNRLNKGKMSGMFGLAMGLAILILAVDAAREVPFTAYALVVGFVGALLTILTLYNKQGFTKTNGLLWIAGFVSAMALSFALLQKVGLQMETVMSFVIGTALIAGIVLWIGNPKYEKRFILGAKNLLIISGATALASIAIGYASTNDVNIDNVMKFILSIGMVSMLVFGIGKLDKEMKKGSVVLTILSSAIFIGAFAIAKINSVDIDMINMLKFVGSIVMMGAVSALLGIPQVSTFVLTGAAVILGMTAMLGLSMYGVKAISDYKINFTNLLLFIGGVATLATGIVLISPLTLLGAIAVIPLNLMLLGLLPAGILTYTISKIKINVGNLGMLIAGIAILAGGIGILSPLILIAGLVSLPLLGLLGSSLLGAMFLSTISLAKINFKNIGLFLGMVGLMVSAYALITPLTLIAGLGAIMMLPIVGTSLLIALTMQMINDLTFENVGAFLLAITGIATAYALITPLAIVGLIGAALTMPIMLSALWTAAALKGIMELKLSNENIDTFNYGLTSVIGAINSLGLVELAKSVAKSVMLLPIMTSMLLSSAVLFAISKLELNPKNIGIFNFGLKSIVNLVDGFGIVQLTKGAAKSLLLLPVMGTMFLTSLVLKAISELDIDPKKMNTFGNVLTEFVDTVLESLDNNLDKLKRAEDGLEAFRKLVNIPTGLIDIIQQMANMRFNEYEVLDGKMVLKNIREFNPDDFARVGTNLAAMLNALIEPLTIIGANTPTFKIGGMEISNPFVKSKASKGVEFLGKLGDAFKPLVDGVDKFAKLELSQDPNKSNLFVHNLMVLVNGFNRVFQVLENIKFKKGALTVTRINEFLDAMESIKTDQLEKINKEIDSFTTSLSNEDRWNKINKNLITIKENFLGISKAINSIDLNKATALNRGLAALSDKNNAENMRKLVEEFAELIGLIREEQEETKRYRENNEEKQKETEKQLQIFNGQPQQPVNPKNKKEPVSVMDMLGEIGKILIDIKDASDETANALAEPLKVIPVDGVSNKFGR